MIVGDVCVKLLDFNVMSLLCQYVDECHSLTDKADSIHEKVSFIIWPAAPAAVFMCITRTCFVFGVFPTHFAVRMLSVRS